MNITNSDYEALKKAVEMLPHGEAFNMLSDEAQQTIVNADTILIKLLKKKKNDNKRTAAYIAEKRKTNKNYAR